MKSVFKSGICLLLLIFLTSIRAQNNDTAKIKKEGNAVSSQIVKQSAVNRDTAAKSYTIVSKGGIKNQAADRTVSTVRRNNPRINELSREINQMVAKYKSKTVKADVKTGKVKFSELSGGQLDRVRREANAYYSRTREKDYMRGNKSVKWKLIEKYYNEKYIEKTQRTDRGSRLKKDQYEEIRRKLSELFDLREEDKRDEIKKLEKQVNDLERKLRERKSRKKDIVNSRLRELLGEPNNLKW